MTHIEAMKEWLEALTDFDYDKRLQAVTSLRQAIAEAEKQEPVAVKRMMEWVNYLKRKSDYGQHMKIPSEMSAGACWELAIELEQFINTHPQPKRDEAPAKAVEWVGLTDEEMKRICYETFSYDPYVIARAIEAKLKEKNT